MSDALSAGTVSLSVVPDTKGFGKLLAGALNGESGNWSKLGVKIGKDVAVGMLAAGAAATALAMNFQDATTKLITGAGETEKNIEGVRKGILNMAGAVGTMPAELAKGMYLIESAGYHGAAGLDVLKAAAMGAKVGGAQMETVANALTTAMTDYNIPASRANAVTSALVATVAAGKMHMEDLGLSLGMVMPKAAALGVSFQDVSGALATMTGAGMSARRASMNLSNTILALGAPSKQASDALKFIGLSAQGVKNDLGTKGLAATLAEIEDHVGNKFPKGSVAAVGAFKNILGGAVGYGTALALTGTHMKTFEANTKSVGAALNGQSKEVAGFALTQKDLKFQLEAAKASITAIGTQIGSVLIPIIEKIVGWFAKHKAATIALAAVIGGALLAATVAWTVSLFTAGGALAFIMSPITLVVAAVAALVAGFIYAYKHFTVFRDVVNAVVNQVIILFQGLANTGIGMVNVLIKAWNLLPWHKDIKLLTDVELPRLGTQAAKTAAQIAALKNSTTHPGGLSSSVTSKSAKGSSHVIASTPIVLPPISAGTFADAIKATHKKTVKTLAQDYVDATKIYRSMDTVIKDSLKAKGDLIAAQAARDVAAQIAYNDASFKLNRTFNDDKFKLDRGYGDQLSKLNRSYNDSIAAAQKSYDDSEIKDKEKHQDALTQIQQKYNDKVAQLNQQALDKQKSVVQKSMDLLRNAYQSATSVDVGSLFTAGGTVSSLTAALKAKLDGAKTLAGNAAALAAKGFSQTFIQQIVGQGTDIGNQMSSAILNATPEAAKQLQELYSQITTVSETGVNALSAQMSTGAHLATSALTTEYAQVAIDLKDSLASAYADLTAANLTENATFTDIMAASLKTLNDAKASAKQTLNQGLADAAISYANSLFDMNTNLNQGLADAKATLEDALKSSAEQFNKSMDSLQYSTMNKMAALQASLQATADAIAKISGASAGARVITKAPKLPRIVTAPSSGSLDMASAAARASAIQSSAVSVASGRYFGGHSGGDGATSADIAGLAEKFDASLQNQARLQQTFSRANGTFQ
jgi:TP901 family phage tail tape measure protein